MRREREIIENLIRCHPDFELISKCVCDTIEAIKEENRYLDTGEIERIIKNERVKRGLPVPAVIRRSESLNWLPRLIEPLLRASLIEQIDEKGFFCIPCDNHNGNNDVFLSEIICKYGLSANSAWKNIGNEYAEMHLMPTGNLSKIFKKFNCEYLYFRVMIESHEDDAFLEIDDTKEINWRLHDISIGIDAYPAADDVEELASYLDKNPNKYLSFHMLKYGSG